MPLLRASELEDELSKLVSLLIKQSSGPVLHHWKGRGTQTAQDASETYPTRSKKEGASGTHPTGDGPCHRAIDSWGGFAEHWVLGDGLFFAFIWKAREYERPVDYYWEHEILSMSKSGAPSLPGVGDGQALTIVCSSQYIVGVFGGLSFCICRRDAGLH